MKSHTLTESILKIAIIFILVLACMNMSVLATDPNDPGTDPADPVEATPYINFEIKTTKVDDGSKQVLVECWGKDFENLVGLDFVFQYDNNKLTPSYLNEAGKINKVLNDLDTIQYVNRPEIQSDEESFFNNSRTILSDSFKLNSELVNIEEKPILKTYVLRFEESRFEEEDEIAKTIMVSISKNDLITQVSDDGTNPKGVKIGTFSFRLADGQTVSTEDFNLIRTLIMCDDGKTTDPDGEEDISLYERDITSNDPELNNIEEIAKFVLGDKPTGSISGTIQTGYYDKKDDNGNSQYVQVGKNIANIYLYKTEDVADIDWTQTGSKYKTARQSLLPIITGAFANYCRPTSMDGAAIQPAYIIETTEATGEFTIPDIEFGNYVLIVDKYDYADYVITNIEIDDINKDIDIENINLTAGDLNKDGIIDSDDRTIFLYLYTTYTKKGSDGGITDFGKIAYDLNDNDKLEKDDRTIMLKTMSSDKWTKNKKNIVEVKTVIDYQD